MRMPRVDEPWLALWAAAWVALYINHHAHDTVISCVNRNADSVWVFEQRKVSANFSRWISVPMDHYPVCSNISSRRIRRVFMEHNHFVVELSVLWTANRLNVSDNLRPSTGVVRTSSMILREISVPPLALVDFRDQWTSGTENRIWSSQNGRFFRAKDIFSKNLESVGISRPACGGIAQGWKFM